MSATTTPPPAAPPPPRPAAPRLGEELPIFCEQCGYQLFGLPPVRCEHCQVLQFQCPECGHHQPINTLRPAAQKLLGRLTAALLGLWVLVKLNYFGWIGFAWFVFAYEASHHSSRRGGVQDLLPASVGGDELIALVILGLLFGGIGRMLLLRFRGGVTVAAGLAAFVMLAMTLGRIYFAASPPGWMGSRQIVPANQFANLALLTIVIVAAGAIIAWPLWRAMVRLLLPQRTATALLNWQRDLSSSAASELTRHGGAAG